MRCRSLIASLLIVAAPAGAQEGDAPAGDEAEAEGEAMVREVDPQIFELALEDYYRRRYAEAAAGFWGYIHYGDAAAENYEWAQFFLGESLRHLGLWHGAVQYYYVVAKTRSRPEILPEALSRLEAISRRRPFSEALVYEDLLYDADFGTLPSGLGDWVHYVQGLLDYKNDHVRWAMRHFDSIAKESPYALKAQYVRAVHTLNKKQDDMAVAQFGEIADSKIDEADTKNKSRLALARLLFDLGNYEDAQAIYDKVEQINLSYEQALLLVEKAWTAYHRKDFRRAMGYLHALEAPSYQGYMLPDSFVLRAIIMKEMCHFIPAKRVVRSFRAKYARALEDLHRRVPMQNIRIITEAATAEGAIARRTALLKALESERKLIEKYDSVWEDVGLDKHLRKVYALEIAEERRRWKLEFEGAADRVALDLLTAEEQMNLLDYEVGLDIFKRLKKTEARQAKEDPLHIPYDSANVYYEFDEEYWNDELHSFEYYINNRCFEIVEEAP